MVHVDRRCHRDIDAFPLEIREDLADAVARLEEGHKLAMPLSRPMPSIGPGVHELRLRDRSGVYRVIYVLVRASDIYLVHAFKKTSQKTAKRDIDLARSRIKEIKP
jgi:phage-related protein